MWVGDGRVATGTTKRAASSEGSARHLPCSHILRKYYVKDLELDLELDRWRNGIDI